MSMNLMVAAMQTKVGNPLRKLVLIKLADNANDLGECWPSYQHIADQCEIDRKTAIRHIRQLESDGFLSITKRRVSEKMSRSNMFQLHLGRGTESLGSPTESLPPSPTVPPRISNSFESVKETVASKQAKISLGLYLDRCKGFGDKAIPENHRVFVYADQVGIPSEYLWLCWKKFVSYYLEGNGKNKKYIDWPTTFCNYVKNNYAKIWWINEDGAYQLTTTGKQAQKEFADHE
jgi:hypothetical protein